MHSNRDWEDSHRQRWQFDKIVRSTHGVNCTGSVAGKSTLKMVCDLETSNRPTTRALALTCPIMNLAAARVAQVTWYLYSAVRLKYPLIRKRLIELWREALKQHSDPVLAWASIMNDPQKCLSYKQVRARRVYPLQLAGTKPADCR